MPANIARPTVVAAAQAQATSIAAQAAAWNGSEDRATTRARAADADPAGAGFASLGPIATLPLPPGSVSGGRAAARGRVDEDAWVSDIAAQGAAATAAAARRAEAAAAAGTRRAAFTAATASVDAADDVRAGRPADRAEMKAWSASIRQSMDGARDYLYAAGMPLHTTPKDLAAAAIGLMDCPEQKDKLAGVGIAHMHGASDPAVGQRHLARNAGRIVAAVREVHAARAA